MIQSYDLSAHDRSDVAVRIILRRLLETLQSNVHGVLEDSNIEFLHDFRVANRRTRTVLSQVKGVLPPFVADAFAPEFKWLGAMTGPCRDLDVTLIEMLGYREQYGIDESALGPLQQFMEDKRRGEHVRVAAALQSVRFQRLVEGWGEFLTSATGEEGEPTLASSPIIEVAGPRILKAYKRIRKRGSGIGVDAPAALLHRLRIDGKKLRYLLEFFSDLYPRATITRFINELKRLQDIIGGFNDTEIQLAQIGDFIERLTESATTQPDIRNGVSQLADATAGRQHELRAAFADHFALFASDKSRRLYKETFKTA